MSELQLLLLVLAAVYVWESLCWLRRGSVAFLNYWGAKWWLAHPAAMLGSQTGGIVLANPLPPLGTVFAVGQSPISISSAGIFSYVSYALNPGWRPAQPAVYWSFKDVREITAQGGSIKVNGKLFVRTGSSYTARRLAEFLMELKNLPASRRVAVLKSRRQNSFDVKAIQARVAEFEKCSGTVRWLPNVLFYYLFAIMPLFLIRFGLRFSWPYLLATLLVLTTATAILFARAHRQLYPTATDERFTHWFMILFSPATSVRAMDALARPLLEEYHPLAVAIALLSSAKFDEFSEKLLREIRYPALPVCPVNEAAPQEVERETRADLLEEMEQFLERHGKKISELSRPPAPADSSCLSYCPRCQAQFTTVSGECADCGGMPLVAFVQSKTARG